MNVCRKVSPRKTGGHSTGTSRVLLLTGAVALQESGHGYPPQFDKNGNEMGQARAVVQWENILSEIVDGFEGYADERLTADAPQFKRAMKLFAKWFPALWD
jgi:hypothetical protein